MIGWLKSFFESAGDETPVTLETVQGKWRMVSVGKDGRFAPPAFLAGAKIVMVIKGDKYTVVSNGVNGDQGTIKIDTNQDPVHFDLHITAGDEAGHSHLGIARIVDGVLENFQGDTGGARPKKFVRKWNDGASLASFRRVAS